ncbi:MAG TPA: hypothetical protein VF331_04915 [Polyangiales bacterium]
MKRQTLCLLAAAALALVPAALRAQQPVAEPAVEPAPVAPTPEPMGAPAPIAPAPAEVSAHGSEATEAPETSHEEGFGKAGVINVASDLRLSVEHTIYSPPSGPAPASVTAYAIGPAADYFVIDNLSLGAQLLFGRTEVAGAASGSETMIRIAPRVGYHISLVPERFGLWPRLELGYETATRKATGIAEITEKRVVLGVFVPLLIHPAEHFHIGIGPYCETDLSSKEDGSDGMKETRLGLRTEIAGWWGL